MEPLKGQVLGAIRLGNLYREEGIIALGHASERWRLTDQIDNLLRGDDEFVSGSTLQEVKEALELRFPSPIAGMSMIEVCNEHDLKRHILPYGDASIMTREEIPHAQRYWASDHYRVQYVPDLIEKLTLLCMNGDVVISTATEEHIRSDDDFYHSDLVIGKRDPDYSVIKYKPSKAAARRKTVDTTTKKQKHVQSLVDAGRVMRVAAATAYVGLLSELNKFGVDLIIKCPVLPNYVYRDTNEDADSLKMVRHLKPLLVIHAALLGKQVYRYNQSWNDFLRAVRDRPKDLEDDKWGNYSDTRNWLATECARKLLAPTKKMIAAKEAKEKAALQARTCASCGTTAKDASYLYTPTEGEDSGFAPGARLCSDCWEALFDAETGKCLRTAEAVAS
jgi:hypothetical protein